MTDEGRDAAIDRIVYMWVGFGYDAGTQSRQQLEAVERLVEAAQRIVEFNKPDSMGFCGELGTKYYANLAAALASLPSEPAKEQP